MVIKYKTIETKNARASLAGYRQKSIEEVADWRNKPWYDRDKLYRILFFTDTKEGWMIEFAIMIGVVVSAAVVFVDSIGNVTGIWEKLLKGLQWLFTLTLASEYLLRIYSSHHVRKYLFGFYGIVDLVSFLPTFFILSVVSTHYALIFRLLRLLSVFRVFHLGRFVQEGKAVAFALKQSFTKILIFILWLVVIVCVLGTIMFLVEGRINPLFSSIPRSIYWAIITLTTVGYGDITPITGLGQFISTVVMLLGYSIIAVPTGIVTAEVARSERAAAATPAPDPAAEGAEKRQQRRKRSRELVYCYNCGHQNSDHSARYCSNCGTPLIRNRSREEDDSPEAGAPESRKA